MTYECILEIIMMRILYHSQFETQKPNKSYIYPCNPLHFLPRLIPPSAFVGASILDSSPSICAISTTKQSKAVKQKPPSSIPPTPDLNHNLKYHPDPHNSFPFPLLPNKKREKKKKKSRSNIHLIMDQPKFVLSAPEVESMVQALGLPSVLHLLAALVQPAKSLARPPISNFAVGAVGLGSDGRVFLGVNLEFPGLPLNHSVHAEQFLLTNLAVHRCPRLVYLAVSAAPCGHCRQFMQELRESSSLQIFIASQPHPPASHHQNLENGDKSIAFKPLSEFLPSPFGPCDLLDKDSPLLLEPHKNSLSLTSSRTNVNDASKICSNLCNGEAKRLDFDEHSGKISNGFSGRFEKNETLLKAAALEAANNSHAPYSGCPSGVALMDCDGKVYQGLYSESAAYNPSLGPVQAALVAYIAGGGGEYERIVAAALVEKENADVSQEDTARLLLKKISPKCKFRVFHCSSDKNGCKMASY